MPITRGKGIERVYVSVSPPASSYPMGQQATDTPTSEYSDGIHASSDEIIPIGGKGGGG